MLSSDWFGYATFRFTKEQVVWAIQHLKELEVGEWPKEPSESGYTNGLPGVSRVRREGAFVKPAIIYAELTARLERTGVDGKLLVAELQGGKRYEELAYESHQSLNYCSGWRRKVTLYQDWFRLRRWRSRNRSSVALQ